MILFYYAHLFALGITVIWVYVLSPFVNCKLHKSKGPASQFPVSPQITCTLKILSKYLLDEVFKGDLDQGEEDRFLW